MRESRIEQINKRIERVSKWPRRFEKLANRKKNPKSEAQFCKDHGLDQSRLNKQKNMKDCIPTQKTIDRVEAALKIEGV